MKKIVFFQFIALLILLIYISQGCKREDCNTDPIASCEGCHTDYAHLKEVYSPDTTAPAGGCGGEAPHYEPYDRVYMGGEGYEAFKKSGHYKVGCTGCHNGVDKTDDKNEAHSGNFISHPSSQADTKCASCHQSIVDDFKTSIHNGTGQKRKVTMRSGLDGPDNFDDLPAHQIEGYNANCATCHGTCGNCHIVRPPLGGGGLAAGHNFTKTPNMITVCVTCHTSRGGHAYLGVAAGTDPDVHLTSNGYDCMNCHSGAELHGDGEPVDQRYAYTKLPKCENCHTGVETTNSYHSMHYDDFNCHVCHSQDYNNCGSCHIHDEGARIPAYLGYKIAVNPIPELRPDFNFALVRRTLAAPDNWEVYGVPEYADFDVFPTYNFTSPHNILRWTSRTTVAGGQDCWTSCHIRNEGGTLINAELYLFQSDLLDWELGATTPITVDGKLPASWFEE
jgi:thiosulfate/3-mercaptopyruvate sulfurtransferase